MSVDAIASVGDRIKIMSHWYTEYKCKNEHKWIEEGGVIGTMHLGRSREQDMVSVQNACS